MAKKKNVANKNNQASKLQKELNTLHQKLKQFGVSKQQLMTYVQESERANRVINSLVKSGLYYGNKSEYTYKTLDRATNKEQIDKWLDAPKHVLKREYVTNFTSWVRGNMERNARDFFGGAVSFDNLSDKQLGRLVIEHPEFQQLQNPSIKPYEFREISKLFTGLYDQTNKITMLVERYQKLK